MFSGWSKRSTKERRELLSRQITSYTYTWALCYPPMFPPQKTVFACRFLYVCLFVSVSVCIPCYRSIYQFLYPTVSLPLPVCRCLYRFPFSVYGHCAMPKLPLSTFPPAFPKAVLRPFPWMHLSVLPSVLSSLLPFVHLPFNEQTSSGLYVWRRVPTSQCIIHGQCDE